MGLDRTYITFIILFLVSHFNFVFIPCGRLSWLPVSFLLHVKYTLSHRILEHTQVTVIIVDRHQKREQVSTIDLKLASRVSVVSRTWGTMVLPSLTTQLTASCVSHAIDCLSVWCTVRDELLCGLTSFTSTRHQTTSPVSATDGRHTRQRQSRRLHHRSRTVKIYKADYWHVLSVILFKVKRTKFGKFRARRLRADLL